MGVGGTDGRGEDGKNGNIGVEGSIMWRYLIYRRRWKSLAARSYAISLGRDSVSMKSAATEKLTCV